MYICVLPSPQTCRFSVQAKPFSISFPISLEVFRALRARRASLYINDHQTHTFISHHIQHSWTNMQPIMKLATLLLLVMTSVALATPLGACPEMSPDIIPECPAGHIRCGHCQLECCPSGQPEPDRKQYSMTKSHRHTPTPKHHHTPTPMAKREEPHDKKYYEPTPSPKKHHHHTPTPGAEKHHSKTKSHHYHEPTRMAKREEQHERKYYEPTPTPKKHHHHTPTPTPGAQKYHYTSIKY